MVPRDTPSTLLGAEIDQQSTSHWYDFDSCFHYLTPPPLQKEPLMARSEKRSSFRQSLKRAFGRKKTHSASLQPSEDEGEADAAQELR